jgi:hypothetical protein
MPLRPLVAAISSTYKRRAYKQHQKSRNKKELSCCAVLEALVVSGMLLIVCATQLHAAPLHWVLENGTCTIQSLSEAAFASA